MHLNGDFCSKFTMRASRKSRWCHARVAKVRPPEDKSRWGSINPRASWKSGFNISGYMLPAMNCNYQFHPFLRWSFWQVKKSWCNFPHVHCKETHVERQLSIMIFYATVTSWVALFLFQCIYLLNSATDAVLWLDRCWCDSKLSSVSGLKHHFWRMGSLEQIETVLVLFSGH